MHPLRPTSFPLPWLSYIARIFDASAVLLGGIAALDLRLGLATFHETATGLSGYYAMILIAGFLFALSSGRMYRSGLGSELPAMLIGVSGRWLLLLCLVILWLFFSKTTDDYSRSWFVLWAIISLLLLWIGRLGIWLSLRLFHRFGFGLRAVALVGVGSATTTLKTHLLNCGWSGYKVEREYASISQESLDQLAKDQVDEIWLALSISDETGIRAVLHALRHSTVAIRFVPDVFIANIVSKRLSAVSGILTYDMSGLQLDSAKPCD